MLKILFPNKKMATIFIICCILGGLVGVGIAKLGNENTIRMIEKYAPVCECACMEGGAENG